MEKPKWSFIDTCSEEKYVTEDFHRSRFESNQFFIKNMDFLFDLSKNYPSLSGKVCDDFISDMAKEPVNLLVSNFPYSEQIRQLELNLIELGIPNDSVQMKSVTDDLYIESLEYIKKIAKKFPELKIVIYSGASKKSLPVYFLESNCQVTYIQRHGFDYFINAFEGITQLFGNDFHDNFLDLAQKNELHFPDPFPID